MDGKKAERTHKIYLNKPVDCVDWQSLEVVQIGNGFVRVRHKLEKPKVFIDKPAVESVE